MCPPGAKRGADLFFRGEKTINETSKRKERAVLAGLAAASMPESERSGEISMEELAALVETAGGECVGSLLQTRQARTHAPSSARARWPSSRSS